MRRLISSGSPFEQKIGYSRAVVSGEWVFVSGTTGFDYSTMTISDDPAEQTRQAFRNISAALAQAGCTLADVVRVKYILPNAADFDACMPVMGEHLGTIRPAATILVAGLLDAKMKIEIEVTAHKPG
ncbi:MAG: RidA family protein [Fimbriiglobus sp.]|jgi:enamine deaminase RidA (YjgF/YER057c/UK114 family)|nr:RidA family protein [Fimbriiglobus sp.]